MTKQPHSNLSRRERQIMDILYRVDEASAADVMEQLPSPPGYSAVRAMLSVLEKKGHILHRKQGPRYVFRPVVPHEQATKSAVKHLLNTFFGGSMEEAVAALISAKGSKLSDEELERITRLIENARKEGS